MPLHLVKLCVGAESIADLGAWQSAHFRGRAIFHTTRMVPTRTADLLAGGSLYWVIKGHIRVRQRLAAIRPFTDKDGIGRCRLMMDGALIPVRPTPRRPFQGWRYLKAEDAPPDLPAGTDLDAMPDAMREELIALGLL